MTSNEEQAAKLRDESIDSLLDSLSSVENAERIDTEIRKQQMAFYDRLSLLAGGTLTLTFTALSVLLKQPGVSGNISALYVLDCAWALLVFSLIWSVLANHQLLLFLDRRRNFVFERVAEFRRYFRQQTIAKYQKTRGDAAVEEPKDISDEPKDDYSACESRAKMFGLVSQLAIFTAYALLLVFFSINIKRI